MASRKGGSAFESVVVRRMKRGAVSNKRVLAPRPFLGPALDAVIGNGLLDRVQAAVSSGLKFERGQKR